jgi:hypothetical protein
MRRIFETRVPTLDGLPKCHRQFAAPREGTVKVGERYHIAIRGMDPVEVPMTANNWTYVLVAAVVVIVAAAAWIYA